MERKRRIFSKEFKLEAVRLITAGGQSISHGARGFGIRDTMLGRWKKDCEQAREAAFPGKGHVKPEEAELGHLRRENERLRMEPDILKKAVATFSKDSL
jgi:transposase